MPQAQSPASLTHHSIRASPTDWPAPNASTTRSACATPAAGRRFSPRQSRQPSALSESPQSLAVSGVSFRDDDGHRGRLVFTLRPDRSYEFVGQVQFGKFLQGIVSPQVLDRFTGSIPTVTIRGLVRAA
jgi:hypothetical protein